MKEKSVSISIGNIFYREFWDSTRPHFLILHGWGGSSESWLQVAKLLAEEGYFVIVPDLPWFWNTPLPKVFTLGDYAQTVQEFIHTLGLKNITLLGHSNGGAITITLMSQKIPEISHYILNNAAGIRKKTGTSIKRKVLKICSFPFKILKFFPFFNTLKVFFYRLIGSHDYIQAQKNPLLLETYKNMISSDLQEVLTQIENPVFLIRWSQDTYTPLADGKKMHTLLRHSQLQILEWVRHGIHLQNPKLLVETIVSYFQKK